LQALYYQQDPSLRVLLFGKRDRVSKAKKKYVKYVYSMWDRE